MASDILFVNSLIFFPQYPLAVPVKSAIAERPQNETIQFEMPTQSSNQIFKQNNSLNNNQNTQNAQNSLINDSNQQLDYLEDLINNKF